MSTLHIILHLVQHIPTKGFCENQHSYDIYIYIYMCVCVCVYVFLVVVKTKCLYTVKISKHLIWQKVKRIWYLTKMSKISVIWQNLKKLSMTDKGVKMSIIPQKLKNIFKIFLKYFITLTYLDISISQFNIWNIWLEKCSHICFDTNP